MDRQQQIDATKSGLAALDAAIVQTESALRMASNPDDVRSLASTLVDLRSERSRLQTQLDNLEAAAVEVTNAPARSINPLVRHLDKSLTDRSIVVATLTFARNVHQRARSLRIIGDNPHVPDLAAGSVGNDPTDPD